LDKFNSKIKKLQQQEETKEGGSSSRRIPIETLIEEEDEEDEEHSDLEEEEKDNENEEGLKIAWQYSLSVQRTRLGLSEKNKMNQQKKAAALPYCHSYDLSKRMIDQFPPGYFNLSSDDDNGDTTGDIKETANAKIIDCAFPTINCNVPQTAQKYGYWLYRRLLYHIQQNLIPKQQKKNNDDKNTSVLQDDNVIRLLLIDAPPIPTSIALPLLLTYIRAHSLPVVILVTLRPWQQPIMNDTTSSNGALRSSLHTLHRISDVSLSIDSFASQRSKPPPEFSDLAGIVTINKCATMTSCSHFDHRASSSTGTSSASGKSSSSSVFTSSVTAAASSSTSNISDRYGLRRDRRKLHIRMLHLPPEDFAGGGSSVSGGGARSGGGKKKESSSKLSGGSSSAVGCSSSGGGGGGGTSNQLDF